MLQQADLGCSVEEVTRLPGNRCRNGVPLCFLSAADEGHFTATLLYDMLDACTLHHQNDSSYSLSSRFCLINAGVLYLYFSSFQQIDEEEYGGTWELTKEGFMTSFALFLVMPFAFSKLISELCWYTF